MPKVLRFRCLRWQIKNRNSADAQGCVAAYAMLFAVAELRLRIKIKNTVVV